MMETLTMSGPTLRAATTHRNPPRRPRRLGAPAPPAIAALVLVAALALLPALALAQDSPLVAELAALSSRYHQDLPRLDAVYQGLIAAAERDPRVPHLLALAEAAFIWADVRASTPEAKMEAYDRGRRAAARAVELAPRNALAHLWVGINAGRWGQTKGVMRSLALLPTVRGAMQTALELDPGLVPAYSLAGTVYYEVPGLLGGDLERSEQMFRAGLRLDPRVTNLRVGLARTLIKLRRTDDARRELQAVLDDKQPRNPADWAMKDAPQARALLESLR
jgi:tetratricopeptide (TPR) repeat protein